MKPTAQMPLIDRSPCFSSCYYVFLPRIQLGTPGTATPSAATVVGRCHGACDLEELQGEPLVSSGKDATGPGMANLGVCDREGALSKSKEVELDLEIVQLEYQDGPDCETSIFLSKFSPLVIHSFGTKLK